ncbi:hypothetical protein [Caulobacter endophyticus]|uniref:Uncharacterized protein n=1 Tax=Caulobacter endophyticus TaxID=2172652 RepID=A0A2T9K533_9CAUL|nr:hypothetical protein [Caulobacter endophyticus]PVM90901.1 hypothetical protein DDF67_08030 [Caulobacter endophyticus]
MNETLALVAALAWPLPMIVALYFVARTRTLKLRVIWAVLCFVGVGVLWMHTATGKWGLAPFAVNILGPGQQPGVLKSTFPAGAVLSLIAVYFARRKARAAQVDVA